MPSQGRNRLSVRGAFGPQGSLCVGARTRASATWSPALHFKLNQCLDAKALDKIIYQLTSSAEARQKSRIGGSNSTSAGQPLEYGIEGFVKFLTDSKAVNTLLFWKDAEEYSTLFGDEERKVSAEKIYERYLKPGAEFEMTSVSAETSKAISQALANPPDTLFENLQQEAYGLMLFELFPRFWESIKEQDKEGNAARSQLTEKTTLKDILAANDLEVHLFAEYCREWLCEDAVIFLLETNMHSLLFDPNDLYSSADRLYNVYLSPTSEGRIVVSNAEEKKIKDLLEEAKKEVAAKKSPSNIKPNLFQKVADEVSNTLSMDVWPRYKEAVIQGKDLKVQSLSDAQSVDPDHFVDTSKPSKKSVAAALRNPNKLEKLRNAAIAQGVKETVEFCVACMEYKMLFSEDDRKPRAKMIYDTYLRAGSDSPVNLPHTMLKKVEDKLAENHFDPDLFDVCNDEVMQVIADNLFAHYLRSVEAEEDKKKAEQAAAQPPPPPASGGGCCLVM